MLARLGLRAPRLATKLYCALGFFLACVCALAFATVQFAGETEATVSRLRTEGLVNVALAGRLQVLIEQHRRLVATAALSGGDAQEEQVYRDTGNAVFGMVDGIAPHRAEKLSARFALLASYGAAVFDLARDGKAEEARAAAARYAAAADGFALEILAESNTRFGVTESALGALAEQARSLVTSVSAGVALIGLIAGPLGLFFLRRMRTRIEALATALIRLARNDTSVDIPGINEGDEFGQLARSVSVFKAKSIELLQQEGGFRAAQPAARRRDQHMPLGLSHVRQQRTAAGVQSPLRRHVRPSQRADPARHRALRAVGASHAQRGAAFRSARRGDRQQSKIGFDADRVRRRAHHQRDAAASARRRLGGAARGHHGAAAAGGEDHASCPPRSADGPRQPRAVPRAAGAEPAAAGARPGASRCCASISTTSRRSTTRWATRSAMSC